MAFPKRPLELSLASLETEDTFSCSSLPLLTGVKGLERSSQKDREGIIKREEKESDRRSAFFPLMGTSLRAGLGGRVLHTGTSFQKPAAIRFTLSEHQTQRKLKGTACGECGDGNRHNRNLIVISKFH